MSLRSIARWAATAALPVALVAMSAAPAAASEYTVPLHQDPPITAAGYEKGDCPESIPDTKDGWHFVLPGNSTDFVKLTVVFEPGGQQVITDFSGFGQPVGKHAYVSSAAGAKLVSASAVVEGGEVKWFNLSHTCPAKTPPTSQPPTSKPPTSQPPTSQPPSSQGTKTPPPTGGTNTPTQGTKAPPPSGSTTPSSSSSTTPDSTVAPTATSGGGDGGSLAQTGTIAVGGILAAAAALVAGGWFLRRRANGSHAA